MPVLKAQLNHEDQQVREDAIVALEKITGEKFQDRQKKTTHSTKPVGPVYDGKTFKEWITLLKTDKSASRRVEGIKALAELHTDKNAAQAIVPIIKIAGETRKHDLDDADSHAVLEAAHFALVSKIESRHVLPLLLAALVSDNVGENLQPAY